MSMCVCKAWDVCEREQKENKEPCKGSEGKRGVID